MTFSIVGHSVEAAGGGSILTCPEVVEAMETAWLGSEGRLADRLGSTQGTAG
jgi:uncharacterized Ntn-hydrolase superfamily protein